MSEECPWCRTDPCCDPEACLQAELDEASRLRQSRIRGVEYVTDPRLT